MADFTTVPWSNGDYVTEAKLDAFMANDEYLRERTDSRFIAGGLRNSFITDVETNPASLNCALTINGVTASGWTSTFTNGQSRKLSNYPITGVAVGDLISIAFGRGGTVYFERLQDHAYLTLQYQLSWSFFDAQDLVLVAPLLQFCASHRVTKSW